VTHRDQGRLQLARCQADLLDRLAGGEVTTDSGKPSPAEYSYAFLDPELRLRPSSSTTSAGTSPCAKKNPREQA